MNRILKAKAASRRALAPGKNHWLPDWLPKIASGKGPQNLLPDQSGRRDLNPRPLDPQSSALPSWATSRCARRTHPPHSAGFHTLAQPRGARGHRRARGPVSPDRTGRRGHRTAPVWRASPRRHTPCRRGVLPGRPSGGLLPGPPSKAPPSRGLLPGGTFFRGHLLPGGTFPKGLFPGRSLPGHAPGPCPPECPARRDPAPGMPSMRVLRNELARTAYTDTRREAMAQREPATRVNSFYGDPVPGRRLIRCYGRRRIRRYGRRRIRRRRLRRSRRGGMGSGEGVRA